jgi:hypothetical protein
MTTWVKAKYPLFNKEISIHCTADDNKRKALTLIVALVGKRSPTTTSRTYWQTMQQTPINYHSSTCSEALD